MLDVTKKRPKLHLMNLIRNQLDNSPNFALLIGAGASYTSGVKPTSQMLQEWRQQLHKQSKSKKKFENWVNEQKWFMDDEEYSILFEKVYDEPSQRRNYIEQCLKNTKLSWGYIFLANLVRKNYFNVCFTPNFDDLLNEACCFYADIKPIVCAHDSAVADIRLTSKRAKIIKLHGDFFYDSIKNTISETESLEKNMRDKFRQFAREYGLIVIGYGGCDRSIMDILEMSLRSKEYFPNGIYWCLRKDSKVSKRLERLMRQDNTYWVEIEGFDEFMADLNDWLGLTLPDSVKDPYARITERLNSFILPTKQIDHPVINGAISKLQNKVKEFEQLVLSGSENVEQNGRLIPYTFLGHQDYNNARFKEAIKYYENALNNNPNDTNAFEGLILSLIIEERGDEALAKANDWIKIAPKDAKAHRVKGFTYVHQNKLKEAEKEYYIALENSSESDSENRRLTLIGLSNTYLLLEEWKKALAIAEKSIQIKKRTPSILNKALALKKLNKKDEAFKILRETLPSIDDDYYRACAYATLGEKEKMLPELKKAIKESKQNEIYAKHDPEFVDYRDDPDFQALFK